MKRIIFLALLKGNFLYAQNESTVILTGMTKHTFSMLFILPPKK